jgi:hypothetical protein
LKKLLSFFVFVFAGTLMASHASAEILNLGYAWESAELRINAGGTGAAKLYFFNVTGEKITHITLSVKESPPDWEIELQPALHTVTVKIGGEIVERQESLYVRPRQILTEMPDDIPEGTEVISPRAGQYIIAKPALVKISVPADETIGKEFTVVINALEEVLEQGGAVAINAVGEIELKVKVVGEGAEEIIGWDLCDGMNCDDGNPCTEDSCYGGVCSNISLSDGTSCEGSKECRQGRCAEKDNEGTDNTENGENEQQDGETVSDNGNSENAAPAGLIVLTTDTLLQIGLIVIIAALLITAILSRKRKGGHRGNK